MGWMRYSCGSRWSSCSWWTGNCRAVVSGVECRGHLDTWASCPHFQFFIPCISSDERLLLLRDCKKSWFLSLILYSSNTGALGLWARSELMSSVCQCLPWLLHALLRERMPLTLAVACANVYGVYRYGSPSCCRSTIPVWPRIGPRRRGSWRSVDSAAAVGHFRMVSVSEWC